MTVTMRNSLGLPTPHDVRQWERKLERLKAEEAEMKARHAAEEKTLRERRTKLERLVAAASAFVEVDAALDATSDASVESATTSAKTKPTTPPKTSRVRLAKRETWPETIFKIVKHANRGMDYAELKEEVAKTHLGDILKRTEKSFYGAIGKLANKGRIIKHHGRLYSPAAYKKFMADVDAGRVEDIPAPKGSYGESPNEIAVDRFLADRPSGATTSEIVNSLLNDPPPDLAVTKNRHSIYNLLKRKRERGELVRRGDRYYRPRPKDEAPDSEKSSASQSQDGGVGNPSSSGDRGNGTSPIAHPGANPAHPGV